MAKREIRTQLVLSGDKEYTDKLKAVNAELSAQKMKMRELQEQYKSSQNSQEALRKKVAQLGEVQKAQTKVLVASRDGLANATKEYNKYKTEVSEIEEKIQKTQVALENINGSTKKGSREQRLLNDELEKYQKKLSEAQAKEKAAEQAVDSWSTKQSKAQGALSRTNTQLMEYKQYLDEAENSANKCAESIDQFGHRVKKAAEEQSLFNVEQEKTEEVIGDFAAGLAVNEIKDKTKLINEAIRQCIDAATEFGTALAKVSTIADTTEMSMDDMKNSIIALSNETGKSVTELSDATYNAISAGVSTAGAVEFVATATKLAAGGFTDNTTAVDILTTVLNAYGLSLDKAGKASDYLIMTQNLGKTTVNELASSLGKVIPVASTYNVEMGNLSAAMAILTSKGIATAEATTYMKAALNELGDSASSVSAVLEDQTGMSFANLMKQGYSLGDVMEIIGKAVNNDKGAFNELWSSSEAGIAALSLLSSGAEKYNSVLQQMEESAGATTDAYEKMANTAEMSQKKFENAFFNLKIAIGDEITQQLSGILDKGTDLLTWVTEFAQQNEWLIPAIEGVAFALGSWTTIISTQTLLTKALIPIVKAFWLAMTANPIGAVALALGTVIALLTPLALKMASAKTEIEEQTDAWIEQSKALNDSVDAYRKQANATEESNQSIREMRDQLDELIAKEEKTTAEKEAIAEITDRLNQKIPNLNLKYDALTDSLNLTTEQYKALYDQMEREQKYENAKNNYSQVYAERQKVSKNQKQAMDELAESIKKVNAAMEIASSDAIEDLDLKNEAVNMIREETEKQKLLEEAIRQNTIAMTEADDELADMNYDMNMYVIESAKMTEAEREAIDAQLESAEAKHENTEEYYAEIAAIAKTAEEYDKYAGKVQAQTELVVQHLQEMSFKYNENYLAALDSIGGQIGLFKEMKTESSLTVKEMLKSLDSQVEYMGKYAENMQKAMEMGVSEGLLAKLSDGSEESAGILQEIVNSGEEKIAELNEKFAKVSEGKDKFASAMAELKTYYGQDLEELIQQTTDAVDEMAQYDNAFKAAQETCNGIISGIDSKWDSVIDKYKALSQAVMEAYKEPQDTHSPSKKFIYFAEMTMEGIEKGVDGKQDEVLSKYKSLSVAVVDAYEEGMRDIQNMSVDFVAAEHQNKLTQEKYEAAASISNTTNQNVTTTNQTFNIYQPVQSPSELARAARLEAQYGLAGE